MAIIENSESIQELNKRLLSVWSAPCYGSYIRTPGQETPSDSSESET